MLKLRIGDSPYIVWLLFVKTMQFIFQIVNSRQRLADSGFARIISNKGSTNVCLVLGLCHSFEQSLTGCLIEGATYHVVLAVEKSSLLDMNYPLIRCSIS